jgi:phenylacetate-CoA ligase
LAGLLSNLIYKYAPIFIQNIGISIYGYKWKKRRFGGIFKNEYKQYINREYFTRNDWIKYQNSELKKLLNHAQKEVPYYKVLFKKNNIDVNKIDLKTLKEVPFLEKSTLRELGEKTLLSFKKEKGGEFYSSSGSTGTPTKILFSSAMHQRWSAAFEARIRNWAGLSIKNSRGTIGGRRVVLEGESKGPFYRYNYFEKQVYFSAYHINSANTSNYIEAMNKYELDYMTGYAMSNYFLARFIEDNNFKAPKLKAVITSSEKLTEEMRNTFKRVYGCKTYDSYSGVEACGLISECEYGKLHISEDVGHIELIKEDGTNADLGEIGEMVCTGFLNYDQPLIRYRIGDMARLSLIQSCECKRNMPIIDEIIGRVEDTVVGQDGRQMVRFHGIFINIPKIIEGQIIQHTFSQFEIKLVTSKQLSLEEIDLIGQRMKSQLGKIELNINKVESIPRNNNGKFQAVISHVK